jgi:hypothetical protein
LECVGSIGAITDGIFDGVLYHGTTPASAVKLIERYASLINSGAGAARLGQTTE